MNKLIIDVTTETKPLLIRTLARLATTLSVTDGGVYHMGPDYSQVRLTSTKTLDEVEDWLWRIKAEIDYVGVTNAT